MTPDGIFRLADMIGSKSAESGTLGGPWYRAVPEPFYYGIPMRVSAAWAVLTGKAVAAQWPEPGDLEKALDR